MQKILVAGLLISVCGPAFASQPTIPIIVKDTTSFYWQTVLAGARKAGKDLGVTVPELGAQADNDAKAEIETFDDALGGKPAAIVIAPTEAQALDTLIEQASRTIKIVGIDAGAHSKPFASLLTTDNVAGGRIAADGLAAAIQDKYGKAEGDVALIGSSPGLDAQRAKGFREEIAAKYPGLKLVVDKTPEGLEAAGPKLMSDLIAANPNLRGVFAADLSAARGVGQVLADGRKSDAVKAIGFDSDPQTIKYLEDGVLAGLVVQDPFRMGYDGIKTALAASKGEPVPAAIDTGATLIVKTNLDSSRSQELLNPKIK